MIARHIGVEREFAGTHAVDLHISHTGVHGVGKRVAVAAGGRMITGKDCRVPITVLVEEMGKKIRVSYF